MDQIRTFFTLIIIALSFASCATNPYAATNRMYKKQTKELSKVIRAIPDQPNPKEWVGTTNFSLRKPNYVIIHHTAQNSTAQTLKTFTLPRTQVSAHYVIGKDGKTFHMLNDYLRAWHGGAAKWGNATDINSSSVGIDVFFIGTSYNTVRLRRPKLFSVQKCIYRFSNQLIWDAD